MPPPLWRMSWRKWRDGYTFDNYPKLKDWERFQSWMDSAGLPEFWKLWGVNHTSSLLPGIWELSIEDSESSLLALYSHKTYTRYLDFSVSNFKGSKTIIISTGTALGAKNEFLKIAYFVCSGVFALTGVLISLKSLIWPRKYNRIDEPEEELIEEE